MSNQPNKKRRINVEIPSDLDATYANFALITHSPSEVIVDFARVLPKMPKARVHARIVMTPLNAKLLLNALKNNLDRYEAQYGEIQTPSEGDNLASQFFGGVKPPEK